MRILKIAAAVIAYLILFDLVGVFAAFLFDISPSASISGALFYALWFVLGIFAGLLSYNTAADLAPGREVCAVSTTLLTALSIAFYLISWRHGVEPDSYVPDSMPLTLTFFTAFIAATFLGHNLRDAKPT